MKCANCDAPLEEGAVFCANCGARAQQQQNDGKTILLPRDGDVSPDQQTVALPSNEPGNSPAAPGASNTPLPSWQQPSTPSWQQPSTPQQQYTPQQSYTPPSNMPPTYSPPDYTPPTSYSPPASGQPYYGGATATKPNSTMAIVSLVSGILSWLFLPVIGSIVAIITGHMARGEINRSNGTIGGAGLALAGLILGYINLVGSLLFCVLFVIGAALGGS